MAEFATEPEADGSSSVDAPSDAGTPPLQRSRTFGVVGFILLATSGLLPWWTVRLDQEGREVERLDLQLWDSHVIAREALMRTSLVLVGIALLFLFVRVAAGSWKHEPASWRRDIAIATGLSVAALVLAFIWPAGQPAFWDTIHVTVDGVDYEERARPGLGWWVGLLSAGLLAAATATARTGPAKSD